MSEGPIERCLETQAALRSALGDCADATCLIPGWEPVDLATGFRWLRSTIYEGFYVKFQIEQIGTAKVVRFRVWEYGDDEPEFSANLGLD